MSVPVLDSLEKAGYRHRDISVGNVMIYQDRGFLIDFDMSQQIKYMNRGKPRAVEHTGTWQFISAARLKDPAASHLLVDDMESLFWVLLWLALNHSSHSVRHKSLGALFTSIFDDLIETEGPPVGGAHKLLIHDHGLLARIPTTFAPINLNKALNDMLELLRPRYRTHSLWVPNDAAFDAERKGLLEMNEKIKTFIAKTTATTIAIFDILKPYLTMTWQDDSGPINNPFPRHPHHAYKRDSESAELNEEEKVEDLEGDRTQDTIQLRKKRKMEEGSSHESDSTVHNSEGEMSEVE